MAQSTESLLFLADWFDKLACIDKPFKLLFYPTDNSIEIIDVKNKRQHLKRIKHDSLSLNDFFVGNTVEIYGRRYKIGEFGD